MRVGQYITAVAASFCPCPNPRFGGAAFFLVGVLALAAAACNSIPSAPEIPDIPLPTISSSDRTAKPTFTAAAPATREPAPALTGSPPATETVLVVLLPALTVVKTQAEIPEYSRNDWKHWVDSDGDCQNTRAEVLILESDATPTFATDRRCRVTGGRWNGPYTGQTFMEAGDLDIDHLVPLKNAHLSGGWQWDAERKEDYANSMATDYHLVAVEESANRAKGARGPEEWQPPDASYHCQYAQDWINVKAAWDLSATAAEWEALEDMLATCPYTVGFESSVTTIPGPPPPTATPGPAAGPTETITAASPPAAGSSLSNVVLITEIMPDPSAVRDAAGEWFEIYNPDGEQAVSLDGWTIGDVGGDVHRISGTVEVPPGGYVVLARNSDSTVNGGITVGYGYRGFNLTNSGDAIELVDPTGKLVDRVTYSSEQVFPGASTSLNPAALSSAANDAAANWCRSSSVMPNGDHGTPGEANDGCQR